MHNRLPEGAESREIGIRDGIVLAPLVAVIVALALWPGLILERGEASVTEKVDAVAAATASEHDCRDPEPRPRLDRLRAGRRGRRVMDFNAPDINYGGISPIIALTGGLVLTLLAGLIGGSRQAPGDHRLDRRARHARGAAGLLIAQWGAHKNLVAGALRLDDLAIATSLIAIAAAAFCIPLSWREEAFDRPLGPSGHGEFQALLICSVLGMTMIAQAQNLIAFFVALELLSIPLYVLCGSALRREELARVRAQVPDHRLARLGDAALRARLRLRRRRVDRLLRDPDRGRRLDRRRPAAADRDRARAPPGSPSSSRSRRSTSGRPTSTRARRRR